MRPACDRVLCEVFGIKDTSIIRYQSEGEAHILDTEFAIDLKIILPCGGQLSGQEKALSNKYYRFKTFTMEFYQNRHTREPGEFFKIASQFYLSGYSDDTGIEFIEWHIIKMFDFMNWIRNSSVDKLAERCRPSTSRANFLPIPYKKIPSQFIFASGRGPGDTTVFFEIDRLKNHERQYRLLSTLR